MFTLRIQLEVLTPLFLGGASGGAEVRAASFRGALRHWYRTVDPEFPQREAAVFGGVAKHQGQSPFLLRVREEKPFRPMTWPGREDLKRFNVGRGVKTKNGVNYLGYVFSLPGNEHRTAVPPRVKINAECAFPRGIRATAQHGGPRAVWQGLLASWWLLGHIGSLGTRARRGFGSLALLDWSVDGAVPADWRHDLEDLPLLAHADSLHAWAREAEQARKKMRAWFPANPAVVQPAWFGPRSRAVLLRTGYPLKANLDWARPMQDAGLKLQNFRAGLEPDRSRARDHVRFLNEWPGGEPLAGKAPERTAFGLPLTFRFLKVDDVKPPKKQFELQPAGQDARGRQQQRFPSPLWIRVVRVGAQHHALLTRLDGTLPGERGGIRASPGGGGQAMDAHDGTILDRFLDSIRATRVVINLRGE